MGLLRPISASSPLCNFFPPARSNRPPFSVFSCYSSSSSPLSTVPPACLDRRTSGLTRRAMLGHSFTKPLPVPTEVVEINGVKVLQHDLFTDDVLYTEIAFDLSYLRPELLPLVPLFSISMMEMGAKYLSFVQLSELISVFTFISCVRGKEDPCGYLIFRVKAVPGSAEDLFFLISLVLQEVQFTDQQLLKQLVCTSKAQMEDQLRGKGSLIAAIRMAAKLKISAWVSEQTRGLSNLEFLQSLEENVDQDWDEISSSLEEIRKSLVSRDGCLINMTVDGKNLARSEQYVSNFLEYLPRSSPVEKVAWNARLPSTNEAIVVPTQVSCLGKAANIYDTGYQLNGSAYVISKYINTTWLRDHECVGGGTYGRGSCDFDCVSGIFSFHSSHDQNLLKTLDVFDETGGFLRDLEMDDDMLTQVIIETLGDDILAEDIVGALANGGRFQLADYKGYFSMIRYLMGITDEDRQRMHEEILSTSLKDFKEFADVLDAVKDKGVVVAVASPFDVYTANKERPNFFQVKKAP